MSYKTPNVSHIFLKRLQSSSFFSLFFLNTAYITLCTYPLGFSSRFILRPSRQAALLRRATRMRAPLAERPSAAATAPCAPVP